MSPSSATTLKQPDGTPYPTGSLDPEGFTLTKQNRRGVITSEGFSNRLIPPWIRLYKLDGTYVRDFPVPDDYIPNAGGTRGVRLNLGFESAATRGKRLYTGTEAALGRTARPRRSPPAARRACRVGTSKRTHWSASGATSPSRSPSRGHYCSSPTTTSPRRSSRSSCCSRSGSSRESRFLVRRVLFRWPRPQGELLDCQAGLCSSERDGLLFVFLFLLARAFLGAVSLALHLSEGLPLFRSHRRHSLPTPLTPARLDAPTG